MKWTSVSSLIVSGCSLMKIGVLARFLDKSDFGAVAIILVLIGFLDIILDSGLSASIIHKKEISGSDYSSLFCFNIFLSFFIYLLTFFLSDYILLFYDDFRLPILLKIMSTIIIISAIGKISKIAIQKELDFKLLSIIDSISSIISLIAAIVLIFLNFKIYALVYSYIILILTSFISYFIFGRKYTNIYLHFNFSEILKFFKVAIYNFLGQLINFLSKEIDILLIGKLMGMDNLGLYSLAKQLVIKPLNIINPILTKVFLPILSTLQNSITKITIEYSKLFNQIISINLIIYSIIFVLSEYIILCFYGSSFLELKPIIRIFCIYMIFLSTRNTIGSLTISLGRTDLELMWTILCILIIPPAIFLGSYFSLAGIIYSLIMSAILLLIPMWIIIYKPILNINFKLLKSLNFLR